MVQKLEAIKGGGGSIKLGTLGTISSLMTRELEASNSSVDEGSSSAASSTFTQRNTQTEGRTKGQNQHRSLVLSSTTTQRQKKKLAPLDDLGNNPLCKGTLRRKTRNHKGRSDIPMLGSENIHLEKTPIREKTSRKGQNLAHVVDIHCGISTAGVLSNRLKKLGFSKLSHSFI